MKQKNRILSAKGRAHAFDSLSQTDKLTQRRPSVPSAVHVGSNRKYDEGKVLASLGKKNCNRTGAKGIDISKGRELGNSTWGKLDFLVNHCGYHVLGKTDYFNSLKPKGK